MTKYFITRHPATIDWAKQQKISVDVWLTHLECVDALKAGDVVIGTLPIQIAAKLTAKKVKYGHFSITVPEALRGTELTSHQLQKCQPNIQFFQVSSDHT